MELRYRGVYASTIPFWGQVWADCLLIPFRLLHVLCIFCGPILAAITAAGAVTGWAWGDSDVWLMPAAIAATPWKAKMWAIIAFYGSCVWVLTVLPTSSGVKKLRPAAEKRRRQKAVWPHVLLWGFAFGPLAMHVGWYTGLNWGWWSLIIAYISAIFYRDVYKDLRSNSPR